MKRVWFYRLFPLALAFGVAGGCSSEDEGSEVGQPQREAGPSGPPDMFIGGQDSGTGAGDGAPGAGGTGGGGPQEPAACDSFEGLEVPEGTMCGEDSATADIKQANMLLVIDKSGSMDTAQEGFGTDRWSALKTALGAALSQVQGIVSFGLELYPEQGVDKECAPEVCCQMADGSAINVPVAPGTQTVPRIVETLDATLPGGGTPTAEALRRALDYFTNGEGASLNGDKFVMLATDGGPNCNENNTCAAAGCTINLEGRCGGMQNCCDALPGACLDDQATVTAIEDLRAAGVDTFVVGIPGSEDYASFLDDFALAGGRANTDGPTAYYAVDAAGGIEGLTNVFTAITTQLVTSCDIQLAQNPPDTNKLNVAVDCVVIPRAEQGSTGADAGAAEGGTTANGWDLDTSTSPYTVSLLGPLCNFITEEGAERIDVIFGCPTIE